MPRLRRSAAGTGQPEEADGAGASPGSDADSTGQVPEDVLELASRIFGDGHADLVTVYVERVRPSELRGWAGSVQVEADDSPETLKGKIAERWGGGEYRLRLTRNGAYVRGGVGLVTISGHPRIDPPPYARTMNPAPPSVVVQAPPAPAPVNGNATLRDTIATLKELQGLAASRDNAGPDLAVAIARLEARLADSVTGPHSAPTFAPGGDLRSLADAVNAIKGIARTLGFVEASKREPNPEHEEAASGPRMPKDPMEILSMMLMMQVMKGMNSPQQPQGTWVPGPDGRPVWQAAPPSPPDPMQAAMMASMFGIQLPNMGGMQAPMMPGPAMQAPAWGPSSAPPSSAPPSSAPPSSAPRVENPSEATAEGDEEEGDDEPLTPAELAEEIAAVPPGQRAAFIAAVLASCPPDVHAELIAANQPPPSPPRPTVVLGGRDAS